MEEKGIETNKNENKLSFKSNSNLFLFDDAYHKLKAQQNTFRCQSANIRKKISFNPKIKTNLTKRIDENSNKNNNILFRHNNFFNSDLKKEQKNETIDLKLLSDKSSRNKLNSNIKTINLSNIFKSNDSTIKLDTTKQSSKRTRILSGKYSSSNSFYRLSKSSRKENKKIFQFVNNNNNKNQFSVINIKVDNYQKKQPKFKKQTLKDLTIQKLIKKSKTIVFDKIIKSNKNKNSEVKSRFYDFYPSFISYNKNKGKKIEFKNDFIQSKDDYKNSDLNIQQNYPIKYSFFDDTINNILHMVNFVDYQNNEELFQKVIIDFKDKDNIKFEDFKTIGYELSPETLYRINQDEKQRLSKIQYEELKRKYMEENSQKIQYNKILREKLKKNYVPEYKLKFKNEDWKNKHYESIYKFHPIKYPLTTKKNSIPKKKMIKINFDIKKYHKNNSLLNNRKIKALEKTIKETTNERKSNSFKIDVIENKKIKSVLKNNIKNMKTNYINKSKESKNKTDSITSQEKVTSYINNNIENKNNLNNNVINNISDSNNVDSSSNNNTKIHSSYKIINQKMHYKDYNSINKIVKVDNIFIERTANDNFKFEKLDMSEYVNKINSKRKYQKRNTFNFSGENSNISSSKKNIKKSSSNIIFALRSKQKNYTHRNSLKISFPSLLSLQNDSFKSKEESKSSFNNKKQNDKKVNKKDNIKGKKMRIIKKGKKDNIINEIKEVKKGNKIENINQINEKVNYQWNDEFTQKNILEKIDNENKLHIESKKIYTPFYQTQKVSNEGYNKIEFNFISSKTNKRNIKNKTKYKSKRQINKEIKEEHKTDKELIKKKEQPNNEKELEENLREFEEKFSKIQGRRMNKSATLDYINKKYKEIESKKGAVNINEELSDNMNKLNFFKDVDLKSVEDIEYNKSVLLFKLREDIRYKIITGQCDKTEMDEYNKFEKKMNEYKINYNLKDTNKIKEYVLLLLVKFNEFMELLSIRENRKMEENRINKFVNNLNYELDYNIPMSLIVKGRRCSSRNYNKKVSSLSDINNT